MKSFLIENLTPEQLLTEMNSSKVLFQSKYECIPASVCSISNNNSGSDKTITSVDNANQFEHSENKFRHLILDENALDESFEKEDPFKELDFTQTGSDLVALSGSGSRLGVTDEGYQEEDETINISSSETDSTSDTTNFTTDRKRTKIEENAWMKFLCFTFGINFFYIISFKCKFRIRVPTRNDFRRFTNFCNNTMTKSVGIVSHQSYALLLKVESTWEHRTARFRRDNTNGADMSGSKFLSSGAGNRQVRRYFWSQRQQKQQHKGEFSSRFLSNGNLFGYFRSLKWNPIPISVGVGFLVFQQYRKVLRRSSDDATGGNEGPVSLRQDWEITCYRMLPWKTLSKLWGWVNNVNLPLWAREPVLNTYARAFNCDLTEAEVADLSTYANLGEFFRRGLKSGVRPIDEKSPIVSPCDGKILHFGKVDCGRVEQVKGVCYSLPAFLGPPTWLKGTRKSIFSKQEVDLDATLVQFPKSPVTKNVNSEAYCSELLKQKSGTDLFYCVLYLAPGDYHRFHSPVEWTVSFRRHIGGELLSVNPSIASWIAGLFSLNERANYVGDWKHGFFSMTAVGATNVGSIRVYRDNALHTNCRKVKRNTYADKYFNNPLRYKKGESFGEFNLGSTIVILFEAPCDYNFKLEQYTHVKMGQPLLHL